MGTHILDPESLIITEVAIQNLLQNSNDLTVSGTGDGVFDLYGLQVNEGSIPFLYTETTSAIQQRNTEARRVKLKDLWRVGTESV